ncbi:hypothetical protein RN001_003262 [Aquatica leii]|uniref:SAP domain-containing protein n=1 Tax=Aquatica leii TaxID=1421715 RepID=A0AAN7PNF6_9COLE|nr:hypothetical protein RN001_003262 [Aquatica leii]
MEKTISNFKLEELKEKLRRTGLNTTGPKTELFNRMMANDPSGSWMYETDDKEINDDNEVRDVQKDAVTSVSASAMTSYDVRELELIRIEKELAERELKMMQREIEQLRLGMPTNEEREAATTTSKANISAIADLLNYFEDKYIMNLLLLFAFNDVNNEIEAVNDLLRPINYQLDNQRTLVNRNEYYYEITIPRYTMEQFKDHFRMSRGTFEDLTIVISNNAEHERTPKVALQKKVLFTIWVKSKQESFLATGDLFHLSKGNAHYIFKEIINILVRLAPTYIQWPEVQQQQVISEEIMIDNDEELPFELVGLTRQELFAMLENNDAVSLPSGEESLSDLENKDSDVDPTVAAVANDINISDSDSDFDVPLATLAAKYRHNRQVNY